MTVEARELEAQAFRLNRLKKEGKDAGQTRARNEVVLFEAAEERIDKYFERRRRGRKNNH